MFNTYPEDFFLLSRQIRMRKIDEYIMSVSITSNPHKDADSQKEFIEDLMSQRRFYRGEDEAALKLDVAAFDKFRQQMQNESISIKAK